jgi:cysteine synthase A
MTMKLAFNLLARRSVLQGVPKSTHYYAAAGSILPGQHLQQKQQHRNLRVAARPSDLVGHTPLLDLTPFLKSHGVDNNCKLYGKMESLGPCSSVKDRLGRSMIDDAEAQGLITPGKTVLVEPTSGNTGIALAFIARERGYRCILTMPETMSIERRMMLLALGCEVVLTPKETAVPGALAKAKEIIEELGGDGHMLQQFENPANAKVHRETTGPEIWNDTDGNVDIFVSGVGTGGALLLLLLLLPFD